MRARSRAVGYFDVMSAFFSFASGIDFFYVMVRRLGIKEKLLQGPRDSGTNGSTLHILRQLLPHLIRHRRRLELAALHSHEDVLAGGDDDVGRFAAMHFEVQVDRAAADLAEVGVDDQQLVERYGVEEVALDVDARQPEAELVE